MGLALFLMTGSQNIVQYWFAPYMQHNLGFTAELSGSILSAYGITQAVARLVLGRFLVPKVSARFFLIVGAGLFALCFVLFTVSNQPTWLFAIAILIALVSACMLPVMISYTLSFSSVLSTYVLAYIMVMDSVGPPFATFSLSILSHHLGIESAILAGVGFMAVIAVIVFVCRRRYRPVTKDGFANAS